MQKTITLKNLAAIVAILLAGAVYIVPQLSHAYTYNGYKWSGNSVTVDVSDPSWPSSWISPLASAMSAWNGATSPFAFSSGSNGHQFKAAANGVGNPLALTTVTHSGSTISDSDTVFNTSYSWSTSGSPSAYDVQNVATHELGHWLSLADLSGAGDTEKTMYFSAALGETKKDA